jgi:hypothetical protein
MKTTEAYLIAPCGMNCSICMAYLRERNPCRGCRIPDEDKPKSRTECRIRNCEKLSSDFCYACEDFPCERLIALDKRYRLKYSMSMILNLEFIRVNGFDRFLRRETKKWKCPVCNGVVCVHRKSCTNCGSKSEGIVVS